MKLKKSTFYGRYIFVINEHILINTTKMHTFCFWTHLDKKSFFLTFSNFEKKFYISYHYNNNGIKTDSNQTRLLQYLTMLFENNLKNWLKQDVYEKRNSKTTFGPYSGKTGKSWDKNVLLEHTNELWHCNRLGQVLIPVF